MDARSLKIGEIYYMPMFLEPMMKKPIIRTRVFIGKKIIKNKTNWYFQDVESYYKYGDLAAKPNKKRRKTIIEIYEMDDVSHLLYDICRINIDKIMVLYS
jgi:hypothetical protein